MTAYLLGHFSIISILFPSLLLFAFKQVNSVSFNLTAISLFCYSQYKNHFHSKISLFTECFNFCTINCSQQINAISSQIILKFWMNLCFNLHSCHFSATWNGQSAMSLKESFLSRYLESFHQLSFQYLLVFINDDLSQNPRTYYLWPRVLQPKIP